MTDGIPLPNFFLIGAAKCGTTSLYQQLRQHPDILFSRRKEPTFFSAEGVGTWQRGWSWYRKQFRSWSGHKAVGEASTSYTKAPWYADAPARLARYVPNARLIYMVRDPADQIRSHFLHLAFYEGGSRTLEELLDQDDFLLSVACYATQIRRYLERFSQQQIMLIPFEGYVRDPVRWGKAVCRFLEVDDSIRLELASPRNRTAGRRITRPVHLPRLYQMLHRHLPAPAMSLIVSVATRRLPPVTLSPQVASRTLARLRPEVEALERMFDVDLSEWRLDFGVWSPSSQGHCSDLH